MVIRIALLGALLAGVTPVRAFVERKLERSFEVSATPSLKVDTDTGAVNVREVEGSGRIEIVVIQTSDVETDKDMDRQLSIMDIDIARPSPDRVAVTTRIRRPVVWSWQSWSPVTLVYEIRVPKRCDVDIVTNDGQITVGAVVGRVTLESETGGVFTEAISGPVTARTRAGQIAVTACDNAVTATTDTGGIVIGRVSGSARLSSRGGFIEVQRASGEVTVRGDGSDAQVGFVAPLKGSSDIVLSGGSLTLQLQTDVACSLDLRASFLSKVGVVGKLPLDVSAGGAGRSVLQGRINGGGAAGIVAHTKGGSILVRAVEPLPPG